MLTVAFTIALSEAGGRIYLSGRFHCKFSDFSNLPFEYYWETRDVKGYKKGEKSGVFSILLLGGSVLHPNNGQVEAQLMQSLDSLIGTDKFKIYNAAIPGHSSRDSRLKLELLADQKFDLLLFYHGINEVRANNCPREVFRDDYSHYFWYDEVNNVFAYREKMGTSILPFLFQFFRIGLKQRFFASGYVPENQPRPEWIDEGRELKTPDSFRQNLLLVHQQALKMGAPVVVPTFVYHLPDNYNRTDFEAKNLDFNPEAEHFFPVELWGKPENVIAGIRAHNDVERDLAGKYGFYLVETADNFPAEGKLFDDVCHLSASGSAKFSAIVAPVISKLYWNSRP